MYFSGTVLFMICYVLLMKTHISSPYEPLHLTLCISVSYLISGSLNPFISVESCLIECLLFLYTWTSTMWLSDWFKFSLVQMCELVWLFLDGRLQSHMRILWFWLWWTCLKAMLPQNQTKFRVVTSVFSSVSSCKKCCACTCVCTLTSWQTLSDLCICRQPSLPPCIWILLLLSSF